MAPEKCSNDEQSTNPVVTLLSFLKRIINCDDFTQAFDTVSKSKMATPGIYPIEPST